ncbi:NAD(P)H-hydrate dehydratase [Syntrophomonas erecta]
MKLVNAAQMRAIDQQTINDYGIPGIVLMENAGISVVDVIAEVLEGLSGKTVVILAGKGNNGGDGFVVARHLINAGAQVYTFFLGKEEDLTVDAGLNYKVLVNMQASIYPLQEEADLDGLTVTLLTCDMVVDAIYGVGFKGSLNEFDSQVAAMVNWCQAPVVAVDIPSGVEADTGRVYKEAIRANYTVTMGLPKIGLVLEPGKLYTGTLSVADISIPRSLLESPGLNTNLITHDIIRPLLVPRSPESHKGTYGHVLVIGGSLGLTGAVFMASYAALRSGAGLVTAALPESVQPVVEAGLIEVMTTPLAETSQGAIALEALPALENLLGTASVCAIGPGMSRYGEAKAVVRFVLEKSGIPVVIDADGLNALQDDISVLKDRQVPVILTPHPGEMARLCGKSIEEVQDNRIQIAADFATTWGITLVLKGNKTVIATPGGELYINISGNPGMATAGSGDVLCGIITGLIAQGLKPVWAAVAGVYLHGLAGDYAAEAKGQRGLIAGDLIQFLPEALLSFEKNNLST